MKKSKFSINREDPEMRSLVQRTDHKVLAVWAKECAERILPVFEKEYPEDRRPKIALETLMEWIDTGKFKMSVIRKASLDSHAAAKEIWNDSPAASVAHACGQAVATAHVKTHAYGPAIYGQQAIFRATAGDEVEVKKERDWQFNSLVKLSSL